MSGSHDLALPPLTLVLGGARSGKSRMAERLVSDTGRPRIYLATADAWDDEMAARIAAHRHDRGDGWQTVEEPRDLCPALSRMPPEACVLLDCATLWLTNHLLAGSDLDAEITSLLHALGACPAPVVVVSNEVGWAIVPENSLARRFRDEQGRLNQRLAAQAGLVVGVMAGLPFVLKGRLPGQAA
ncbi:bifunctional adenosylcobinamide kinase/adenosylcobinamide-phosphate guanylyltransferase [Cereibacter sphaeroides]|uniref:bifunctional adenosylcobinamide kinase/adenosylcobinamide-phosphate guanylyltransferase n=1 Tax=Rhodobacterales TaxID=204455 RepID=UPI000BBE856E|nr:MULTISPECIES: bifunctional adenosylcobinamide kinase/adenosylcobinamide-phosphate guanylyltransferase [Paracoccaceae]MCE6949861.1 bifunctional adenosylcobinamide kinase/adenosylcobinamide-phosphate guanylyltransferase [Cereibacter sphaeroides]MCE6957766.1 bifunctional adenosylcobinamide kinase/adenosylcobinamide-phosphate guanylyltransferase [Cereibacter sphaeroides]MCE6967321.1 bifunctional adenosylcobinamide kinase/adenosylcobinamide-phosphate guanylyltransferase [Cereibacter sphaeroides]M